MLPPALAHRTESAPAPSVEPRRPSQTGFRDHAFRDAVLAILLGTSCTLGMYDGASLYYHLLGFGVDPPYGLSQALPTWGLAAMFLLLIGIFALRVRWLVILGGAGIATLLTALHWSCGKDLEYLPPSLYRIAGGLVPSALSTFAFTGLLGMIAFALVTAARELYRRLSDASVA